MPMIYQLKIQLQEIVNPPVWRRILIPCNASFADLHNVIQEAFGWQGYHLHEFVEKPRLKVRPNDWRISDDEIGDMFGDEAEYDNHKDKETAIAEFLNPMCPKISYEYDFGDGWVHSITLENAYNDDGEGSDRAHCIDGKGVTPPEDCGGPDSFMELRDFIRNNPEKSIQAARGQLPEEEIMEDELGLGTVRWAGEFFTMVKDKPDFAKIDLEKIEEKVSKVPLSKIKFKSRNEYLSQLCQNVSKRTCRSSLTEADKEEIKELCRKVFLGLFGLNPDKKW